MLKQGNMQNLQDTGPRGADFAYPWFRLTCVVEALEKKRFMKLVIYWRSLKKNGAVNVCSKPRPNCCTKGLKWNTFLCTVFKDSFLFCNIYKGKHFCRISEIKLISLPAKASTGFFMNIITKKWVLKYRIEKCISFKSFTTAIQLGFRAEVSTGEN